MKSISQARSLAELHELLTGPVGRGLTDQEWTDLPTFGGTEPRSTDGVWSWDAESLLVGTCADDLQIVPRGSSALGRRGD